VDTEVFKQSSKRNQCGSLAWMAGSPLGRSTEIGWSIHRF